MNDLTNCDRVRARLAARHDGEALLEAGCGQVGRHVASCPTCAGYERELGDISRLFGALRNAEPPERLFGEIAERVAAPKHRLHRTAMWTRFAAGLVGFLSVFALSQRDRALATPAAALEPFARAGRAFASLPAFDALPERELLAHLAVRRDRSTTGDR